MNTRIAVIVLALSCAAVSQAGQVLIIDDFTEPAVIQVPNGPEEAITTGVGDLSAERTLFYSRGPASFWADINGTRSDEYFVDVEDVDKLLGIYLQYTFPTHDFGRYEAIRFDITTWPAESNLHRPFLEVRVWEAEWPHLAIFDGTLEINVGRLVLPLDMFYSRLPPDWSAVNELWIRIATSHRSAPLEIAIDRISFGPIPEPQTFALTLLVAACCAVAGFCSRDVG